jgi:uncharacterized protein YqjF (DUF2071 family)
VSERRIFLTAEWRHLVLLNYRVDPSLLDPFVPRGTRLDLWNGDAYVSVVGFLFRDTRLLGVRVPFHDTFEEVNLRFYVQRTVNAEVRRAVTFIRELVPRRLIALTARLAYNEPYLAVPMRHALETPPAARHPARVEYAWRYGEQWTTISGRVTTVPALPPQGSEEEFIVEHYWGYTRQRNGGTIEYEVRHPRWDVARLDGASLTGDVEPVYGASMANALDRAPDSAMYAVGSPVTVSAPIRTNGDRVHAVHSSANRTER